VFIPAVEKSRMRYQVILLVNMARCVHVRWEDDIFVRYVIDFNLFKENDKLD
jgi:hypothetical protein